MVKGQKGFYVQNLKIIGHELPPTVSQRFNPPIQIKCVNEATTPTATTCSLFDPEQFDKLSACGCWGTQRLTCCSHTAKTTQRSHEMYESLFCTIINLFCMTDNSFTTSLYNSVPEFEKSIVNLVDAS